MHSMLADHDKLTLLAGFDGWIAGLIPAAAELVDQARKEGKGLNIKGPAYHTFQNGESEIRIGNFRQKIRVTKTMLHMGETMERASFQSLRKAVKAACVAAGVTLAKCYPYHGTERDAWGHSCVSLRFELA